MTDIEQVLQELLTPHGYATPSDIAEAIHRDLTANHAYSSNNNNYNHYYYHHDNKQKTIRLTGTQIKLLQWDDTILTSEITVDLSDPNSLQIIEDWAKQ